MDVCRGRLAPGRVAGVGPAVAGHRPGHQELARCASPGLLDLEADPTPRGVKVKDLEWESKALGT